MKSTTILVGIALAALTCISYAAETSGTLQKIKDTHEVVLGYREDAMPFAYIDNAQHAVGFSVDLCQEIVKGIAKKLDLPELKVSYQPVTASNRIPLLVNGSIDLECGSTTNTAERQKAVSFLYTTYVTGTKVLVRTDSGINEIKDLKGKKIAVTSGTNNIRAVQRVNKEDHLSMTLVHGDSHAVNFLQLQNGRVDGFSTDDILLSVLRAQSSAPNDFKLVAGPLLSVEPYAIAVRKNDPQFKELANALLKASFDDGRFTQIYDKWFTQPIPPKNINLDMPMSDELKQLMKHPNDSTNPLKPGA